jgi:hypothetical protein
LSTAAPGSTAGLAAGLVSGVANTTPATEIVECGNTNGASAIDNL